MTVRRLDIQTGDIVTSGVQFITERDEVAQTITTRLRLFLAEYFRDITDGTQWFEIILNKQAEPSARDAEIKRRIIETENVERILSFSSDYNIESRTYTVSTEVLSTFGLVQIQLEEGF